MSTGLDLAGAVAAQHRQFRDYSQCDTPPCPEQVPLRVWEKLYEPSLHWALAPAGAEGES